MRPRTARTLLASALLPLALLLGGCSGLTGTGELDYVPGNGGVVEIAEADREPPVELSGETTTGEEYTLERGKVTVINVWFSTCGPCIREMPMLTELDAAYDGAVEFLGINIRDSVDNARAFERDRGVEYPSIFSPDGEYLSEWTDTQRPTHIVFDAQGDLGAYHEW